MPQLSFVPEASEEMGGGVGEGVVRVGFRLWKKAQWPLSARTQATNTSCMSHSKRMRPSESEREQRIVSFYNNSWEFVALLFVFSWLFSWVLPDGLSYCRTLLSVVCYVGCCPMLLHFGQPHASRLALLLLLRHLHFTFFLPFTCEAMCWCVRTAAHLDAAVNYFYSFFIVSLLSLVCWVLLLSLKTLTTQQHLPMDAAAAFISFSSHPFVLLSTMLDAGCWLLCHCYTTLGASLVYCPGVLVVLLLTLKYLPVSKNVSANSSMCLYMYSN